jgi:hypothetical protein
MTKYMQNYNFNTSMVIQHHATIKGISMKINFLSIMIISLLLLSCSSPTVSVQISNPLGVQRNVEVVGIDRDLIDGDINTAQNIVATYAGDDQILPIQLVDEDQNGSWDQLLVLVSLEANETREMVFKNSDTPHRTDKSYVFGRLVPERMDDFAWENDRIAFRMYGPALEKSGEISSGVDVWTKSVDHLIIDNWYALEDYHKDHGEGGDFYKVGPTLGCGGLGLLYGDSLYTSNNFTDYRILAEGPLRFAFELDFEVWGPSDLRITETKRITLDAGSHFNKIFSRLALSRPLEKDENIVTGLVSHPGISDSPVMMKGSSSGLIVYESMKEGHGEIGTAVIDVHEIKDRSVISYGDQNLITLPILERGVVQYYAGAGWSKSPWVKNTSDWIKLVENFETRIKNPLQINIKKN